MVRVWGQPKAWCDTQICIQLSDLIAAEYGQTVIQCDCLGARWSQHSLLAHWANQSILAPIAPGGTATLAEPDTHEHFPMKAAVKHVKANTHFALEQECKNKNVSNEKIVFGPNEYLTIISKAIEKFSDEHPQVPLQGVVENHMLAIRPVLVHDENQGSILKCRHLDDLWQQDHLLQQAFDKHKTFRYPQSKGIATSWCRDRDEIVRSWCNDPNAKPTAPDWSLLTGHPETQDVAQVVTTFDQESDPVVFDIEFKDLELSDHQKVMLLPTHMRINQLVYPLSVQERVETYKRTVRRKNKWIDKLSSVFTRKARDKWRQLTSKHGRAAGKTIAKSQLGPTVVIKRVVGKRKTLLDKAKKKLNKEALELKECEWLGCQVRVTDDSAGEKITGRCGLVVKAFQEQDKDKIVNLSIVEDQSTNGEKVISRGGIF